MPGPRSPLRSIALHLAALFVGAAGALLALPWLPVSVAVGPCLRDWTSPSSYARRVSPLATVDFAVGGDPVRVCYGRPSARGRQVFDSLVPFGALWRTGANEPTRLFTRGPIRIGEIELAPGRYSLYTEPGPGAWRVFVSRSTFHWGNAIDAGVRAREVGSLTVPVEELPVPVETFTIRPEPAAGDTVRLVLEWEQTRVALPILPNQELR